MHIVRECVNPSLRPFLNAISIYVIQFQDHAYSHQNTASRFQARRSSVLGDPKGKSTDSYFPRPVLVAIMLGA